MHWLLLLAPRGAMPNLLRCPFCASKNEDRQAIPRRARLGRFSAWDKARAGAAFVAYFSRLSNTKRLGAEKRIFEKSGCAGFRR